MNQGKKIINPEAGEFEPLDTPLSQEKLREEIAKRLWLKLRGFSSARFWDASWSELKTLIDDDSAKYHTWECYEFADQILALIFWSMFWRQHNAGGHYKFKIDKRRLKASKVKK